MSLVGMQVSVNTTYENQSAKESDSSEQDEEEIANDQHVSEVERSL